MVSSRLVYSTDEQPGHSRRRAGTGFAYLDADGETIGDAGERRRIEALAIPPAWEDVWINPNPDGHIQATGRDARGRKQYIYHRGWRAWREQTKFAHVVQFARVLPRLRRQIARDLRGRKLTERLVLAAAVRVLEQTLMRVGNEEYANHNQTYGLTTLRHRHLKEDLQGKLRFSFTGKHGKPFEAPLTDRRTKAVLRRLEGLPGQHLFQYVNGEGTLHHIHSDEINAYIREATGGDFTAKDFRTWSATVLAALAFCEIEGTPAPTKKSVRAAIEKVARRLGNTPTVCRQSYIHPAIVEGYLDGELARLVAAVTERAADPAGAGLSPIERRVLAFLKRRLARERKTLKVKLVESAMAAAA